MHSTHSYDGKVPLVKLKELLQAEGISFACMTEHTDTLTQETARAFVEECHALSDEKFLFIPGFEVPYKHTHILMMGAESFVCDHADASSLKKWRAVCGVSVLAHPVRNRFVVDEIIESVIDGVEIWNQQYEGKRVPRIRSYRLLETLRKKNNSLVAFGGLDLHRTEHLTFPRIRMEIQELSSESILSKLKRGEFAFGNDAISVCANIVWNGAENLSVRVTSAFSILVIVMGKTANALFSKLGITVPKNVTQAIRSRV